MRQLVARASRDHTRAQERHATCFILYTGITLTQRALRKNYVR
jgi:hypothetical protein